MSGGATGLCGIVCAVRRLSLIVNPVAGGGRPARALPGVQAALRALGLEQRFEYTTSLSHARELALAAAAAGEVAVAFGGDGLIGAVAGALKHSEGVVGVLPGGRGNDLCRVLGIPSKPVAACSTLASGVERSVDLGEAGGRTFAGIASCGFDSLVNRIANETTVVRGSPVYAFALLRALPSWKAAAFEVTLDGAEPRRFTGYSVAAANSKQFGGGMRLAPSASLTDGLLDVVIIEDMPKLRFLRLAPTVFVGRHVRHRGVTVLRSREVRIESAQPFTLYADGEAIAELPVTVRLLPAAVRVIVPR
ncbi:MAG: diacylglycerol kinase family lipid kinase [Solirubrobacterales bacterium]|nr:diacylglycerol kinase family lipid kinase [Solirubrobacterales bacterium]